MKRPLRETTRVCFEENLDTVIADSSDQPNNSRANGESDDNLWYAPFEIAHFKRQNEQLKETLGRIDRASFQNPSSWSYTLRRLHGACCKLATAADVVKVLQSTQYPFSECTLGLERQGIPSIAQCVLQRRAEIYAGILELQYSNLDADVRVHRIREASCAISHASVLYARLLAEIVAATTVTRYSMVVDLSPSSSSATYDNKGEYSEDDLAPLPF